MRLFGYVTTIVDNKNLVWRGYEYDGWIEN
jgi:hypothetical protein